MKKFIAVILLLCTLTTVISCSKNQYVDDRSCKDVGNALVESLDDGLEYTDFDSKHISAYFDDTEEYDDHFAVYSTDTNDINELGIFHAPNKNMADELYESCCDYIEDIQEESRAFIASYAPDELPKLDNATVKRFDNYVVYTVLPDDKAEAVYERLESELKTRG